MKKLVSLLAISAMFGTGSLHADYCSYDGCCYQECQQAPCWLGYGAIGLVIIAGIIAATTGTNGHSDSSSSSEG